MVTNDLLICWLIFQVNVFHVVHHVRGATKGACALRIRVPFVANTYDALGLVADEREFGGRREGIGTRTFFLYRSFVGWRGTSLWSLLPRSERDHEVDCTDLAANDVLHTQVHREVAEDPLQPGPFFELMLNNRLDVHVSHSRLVQLSLHLLIMKAEDVVLPELPIDLNLQVLSRVGQLF
jgi:hypothetical protein